MNARKILILALVALSLVSARPTRASHSTGNAFVTAVVDDTAGWIWFLAGSSSSVPPSVQLTKRDSCYLSLMVGYKLFSNMSPEIVNYPDTVRPDVWLLNGKTSKSVDTVSTIWRETGFDIVQEVYPVAFEKSGQIVVRFKVINHRHQPLPAQAQYLIDIALAGSENNFTLTNYEYSDLWQYHQAGGYSVPPFYTVLQNSQSPSDPGLDATGYLSDSITPFPLGLREPEEFIVGDMLGSPGRFGAPSLLWQRFGPPDQTQAQGHYQDNGYYLLWPGDIIPADGADTVHELARTSLGTGEFDICRTTVTTYTFYPHRLYYDVGNDGYLRNPFPVESITINPSRTITIPQYTISQHVTGPLKIVAPTPVTPDGHGQARDVPPLRPFQVAESRWMDSVLHSSETTTDSIATLTVNTSVGSGYAPACVLPILVEAARHDTIPPAVVLIDRAPGYNGVDCNSQSAHFFAIDTAGPQLLEHGSATSGLASIALDPDAENFELIVNHFAGGPDTVPFMIRVIDSLRDAHATVIIKDRARNVTKLPIEYCTIADSLAPFFTLDTLSEGYRVTIHDDRPWDRGLAWLDIIDNDNALVSQNSLIGFTPTYSFTVRHEDPSQRFRLWVEAIDEWDHHSNVCYIAAPPIASVARADGATEQGSERTLDGQKSLTLTLTPNPTDRILHGRLAGAREANVRVLDILGREVGAFEMRSETSYDMTRLPSGVYTVEITAAGKTVTARIVRE